MKKKLLVFHDALAPYRLDLFNEFNKSFDMRVCFFRHSLYSGVEEQLDFSPVYIEKKRGVFFLIKHVLAQLLHYKPEIILCSEFNLVTLIVVLFNFFKIRKYCVLSTVDDSYDMIVSGKHYTWRHPLATKILMPFLDNVINVEPKVVEYYQRIYGKGLYMPIIVDENKARARLQRILSISQEYVEKYNLEGKKILLFVGRLIGIKNISFAIKAFFNLHIENTVFVIVGDGTEKEKLFSLVNERKNVIFTGRLEGEALYAWYNIAQIFTLPSLVEPFGAVTNEALLGGCYALVSKTAGSNCLIEENVNGNLIDPNNQEEYEITLEKAFKRVSPVSFPLRLRKNAMKEPFHDCINRLFSQMGKK